MKAFPAFHPQQFAGGEAERSRLGATARSDHALKVAPCLCVCGVSHALGRLEADETCVDATDFRQKGSPVAKRECERPRRNRGRRILASGWTLASQTNANLANCPRRGRIARMTRPLLPRARCRRSEMGRPILFQSRCPGLSGSTSETASRGIKNVGEWVVLAISSNVLLPETPWLQSPSRSRAIRAK